MRELRLLIVLSAVALAGGARHSAPQYVMISPASGRQQVVAMPQSAQLSAPVAKVPRERGLFTPPPAAQVLLVPQVIQVPPTP